MTLRLDGHRREGRGVPVPDQLGFAGLLEALAGVLADGLQHQQPRVFEVRHPAEQALVGQLVEPGRDVDADLIRRSAHRLRLFQAHAAGKHRKPRHQAPGRGLEEVVTPRDRARQRLLPVGQVA